MAADHLQRMQAFCAIVDNGGIRAAAQAMRLSPASVSSQLAALETHLGVRLLERSTRRLDLTEDGAAYLAHCQRILAEIAETEALLARSRTTPKGRLTVDVPTTIGRLLLLPHLPHFYRRYPEVEMELTFSFGVEVDHRERHDVLIRIGPLHDSSMIARPIGQLRSVVVASPEYLARHGTPTCVADLSNHRAINYIDPVTHKVSEWALWQEGRMLRFAVASAFTASEHEARLDAAEAGMGLAQMLSLDVQHSVRAGRLVTLLDPLCMQRIPLYVVYKRNRHLSAKVRSFVDFIAERFPGDGNLDPLTAEPWWQPPPAG